MLPIRHWRLQLCHPLDCARVSFWPWMGISLASSCLFKLGLNYFMHFSFLLYLVAIMNHQVLYILSIWTSQSSKGCSTLIGLIIFNITPRASWLTVFPVVLPCTACFKILFSFIFEGSCLLMGITTLFSFPRAHPWFFLPPPSSQ